MYFAARSFRFLTFSLLVATLAACTPPTTYPDAKQKGAAAEPPVQRQRMAYLEKTADVPVTCTFGADCKEKWARAHQWVEAHSVYSIKSDTTSEIATYGPIEPTTDSAFDVKLTQQDANSNAIAFESACGQQASQTVAKHCIPSTLELKSSFKNFVMYGN